MDTPTPSRPRRARGNYGSVTPSRSPGLNIPLSFRRKGLITTFKDANRNGMGTTNWILKLFEFLSQRDPQVTSDDVNRWISKYAWITSAAGPGPFPVSPMVASGNGRSSTRTTRRSKTTSTPSPKSLPADQVAPDNDKKKVRFRRKIKVKYITPRATRKSARLMRKSKRS